MGISSLLGLVDSIGNVIGSVLSWALQGFAKILITWVIQPLLQVIINIIQYYGSSIFYMVSKFLMGLIDFVEVLFRALAGLPSIVGEGESITFSLNGQAGDLLIQMLRSPEVLQAFYATAIVGIFLLIITTIFQMIKVEYTTEGAQNSKSGIIGKSLKSLCNMLIIPILCILGVFIGNQVLDLIDTATGGGEGAKISGILWVTAASEALIDEGSLHSACEGIVDLDNIDNEGGLYNAGITLAITRGFGAILGNFVETDLNKPLGTKFSGTQAERDNIENQYLKGTKSYYKLSDVVQNYNPFEVNYLVLIFGACIIIKCLFFTCFGLIDRLYQCTALFIIMPMVIGMSPVKDSLGSWRGKFMQQALSAYGVVISMNLFFIIVKVLLNIDIKFGSSYNNWVFSPTFMSGLIKSIMVIVGCLMIEKLSGDLGGYFGGGDALKSGTGLAKDATAGLKKAAVVGGGLMALGANPALGAVKAAGGIANKLSGGALGRGAEAIGDKVKSAGKTVSGGAGKVLSAVNPSNVATKIGKKITGVGNHGGHTGDSYFNSLKAKEQAQNTMDLQKESWEQAKKTYGENSVEALEEKKKLDTATKDFNEKDKYASSLKNKLENGTDAERKAVKKVDKQINDPDYKKAEQFYDDLEKENKEKSTYRKNSAVKVKTGLSQMVGNTFGTQALFNTVAPKGLQKLQKDYEAAAKSGMAASPEGQAIYDAIEKVKKDKAEADFNKSNAGLIGERNQEQLALIMKTTNEKLQVTNKENTQQLQKLNELLKEAITNRNNAKNDESARMVYTNQIASIQDRMKSINSKIKFDDVNFSVKNESELKVDFKLGPDVLKKLQDQIKKGMKMDDIMKSMGEEFKKIGLNDKDTLAKIYKALEELKSSVGK